MNWMLARCYPVIIRAVASRHRLIVCAGMPRSGSTWLFNVVRSLCLDQNLPVYGCWIGDPGLARMLWFSRKPGVVVIKVHGYKKYISDHADTVLYSIRDIRDVIASKHRLYNRSITRLIDKTRRQLPRAWEPWRQEAAYTMRYESMICNQLRVISEVANVLGLRSFDAGKIQRDVAALRFEKKSRKCNHDRRNLLHPGHITDGRHGSWRETLPESDLAEIEEIFGDWLQCNGYK